MRHLTSLLLATVLLPLPVIADDRPGPQFSIELNKLDDLGKACRMSLVLTNRLETEIEDTQLELVLFDKGATVIKLLAVNPGQLPAGKTVRLDVLRPGCYPSRLSVRVRRRGETRVDLARARCQRRPARRAPAHGALPKGKTLAALLAATPRRRALCLLYHARIDCYP